jgi:mannose-1-phosphate guanylyltransferase
MVILIVAGGKGTRLWPLSTPDYPKQLIDVSGQGLSLIQQAYGRAKKITSVDRIFIATEASHGHLIAEQIPEIKSENIIIEPTRRNTMAAIITALSLIAKHFGEDEVVASLWADHHINDVNGLTESLSLAAEASLKNNSITVIGSEPLYPHTGMGHIKKGDKLDSAGSVHKVSAFKEKPDFELAKKYTNSGDYLWNTGYIITNYKNLKLNLKKPGVDSHWLEQLSSIEKSHNKAEIDEIFLKFKSEPIDTALNEKLKDMIVISATFDWIDVGGLKEVHHISNKDEQGVSLSGNKSLIYSQSNNNVYINNKTNKPLAVIGIDDIAVVSTENGTVIIKLNESQKIKDAANFFGSTENDSK